MKILRGNKLLLLIILLALVLRVVGLSSYPTGFTQDEASFGYDAYSLLKTGKDQWGKSLPLTLRSFGDFKLSLYSYMTIPSVLIFGLNEFSTRLPNAICGVFAVLFTYLMVYKLFTNRKLALLSSFFLATSPWHISLSRGAFEANLTTLFIPIAVWSYLKGLNKPSWMIISAFAFGVNLFTYHSARLFTPILLLVLVATSRKSIRKIARTKSLLNYYFLKRFKWAIFVFGAFSITAAVTMFMGAGTRGSDILILNPTDRWTFVSERRYEAVLQGVPDQIARVFSNKATHIFSRFVKNYLSYLSPAFYFTEGAGEWTYGMIPGRGVLYLFEVILIVYAIAAIVKKQKIKGVFLITLWIILSPIPASLTKSIGLAANRMAVMMPAIQVLSAYGAISLKDMLIIKFNRKLSTERIFFTGITVLTIVSSAWFLEDYIFHAPISGARSMHYGMREVVEYIDSIESSYQEVLFSRSLSVPQIWVGFYKKLSPLDYQKASKDWLRYEEEGHLFVDQLGEYKLGKYTFTNIDINSLKKKKGILLFGYPEEFPEDTQVLATIYYSNNKPALLVVDSIGL
jgi:4-amino-4-deoxy-L-arabinose transferase-like glycosyltransferase